MGRKYVEVAMDWNYGRSACWVLGMFLLACDPLTSEEAQEALAQLEGSSASMNLTGNTAELSTTFTLGQGVEAAADELRTYVESQLPCAEVTSAEQTLTIEYGAKEGNCTFRGQSYEGIHAMTLEEVSETRAVIRHVWTKLRNQTIEVSGDATVTWDAAAKTRRVEHELEWTKIFDGRVGTGSGDRTQRALDGDIAVGMQVDGNRAWEGTEGRWTLDIDEVSMRWEDPVPQEGRYALTNPDGKALSASFSRVDEDTIKVTLSGPRRSFDFDVKRR